MIKNLSIVFVFLFSLITCGQKRAEMSYSDGELEGMYLLYNKKGELVDQKLYVHGVKYSIPYNELNDSYRYTPSSELN
ncbi:hypothetical protein [Myroides odoratimimus]|uniref:hypothetical protein n=1 Tax=Myroides odoratimimus TaxID=76832 RepID=UPI003100BCFB